MTHFKRRNIFQLSCEVWSARHRSNAEVFWKLLVKDNVKIRVSDTSTLGEVFSLEVPLINLAIPSAES